MRPHCVRTASSWRPRRPHCAVTALPLRTHGVHTALIQIAVGTPSHGAHFVHAQSARRGMASWETPRRPVEMPRRSLGALGDLTARNSAFWVFLARRAVAVRTPPWCDRGFSDPDMHHGTCAMHVPGCMPGSLTSGFLWSQWRGKRSRHSWYMRNPQSYVSGKRPMAPLMFSFPLGEYKPTHQWLAVDICFRLEIFQISETLSPIPK